MTYSQVDHYLHCMKFYFDKMVYKKGETYYINEIVDINFSFINWIEDLSDEEIMYNCDNDNNVNPKEIRDRLRFLEKQWVGKNCEGDLI